MAGMDDGSRWYVKNGDKVISEHATESEALAAAKRIGTYYLRLAAIQQGRWPYTVAVKDDDDEGAVNFGALGEVAK